MGRSQENRRRPCFVQHHTLIQMNPKRTSTTNHYYYVYCSPAAAASSSSHGPIYIWIANENPKLMKNKTAYSTKNVYKYQKNLVFRWQLWNNETTKTFQIVFVTLITVGLQSEEQFSLSTFFYFFCVFFYSI